ncbi:DNA topoisomerase [Apiospora hydei]|uniref:DNA topoisomerase I n=1 Tax=Apiospora hydei TaxID=1337664 RepID=A0ABR1WXT4_9PEZI
MSSDLSDDNMPLARPNGKLSADTISKSEDKAMDKGDSAGTPLAAPVSIRNGPVQDGDAMDVDSPAVNGHKRKTRTSIGQKPSYKDDSDSDDQPMKTAVSDDSDDDVPLKRNTKLPPKASESDMLDMDSDDDDKPLHVKLAQKKAGIEKSAAKDAKKPTPKKKVVKDESDSDAPLASAKGKKRQSNGTVKSKTNGVKKEESDSDAPIRKKAKPAPAPAKGKTAVPVRGKAATTAKGKAAAPAAKKGTKAKKEESEEPAEGDEEEFEWWNKPKKEDDSTKWETLEHNGVMFPPLYEPLPKHVKLLYDGTPVTLHPDAEEVATFFGGMLHQPHHVENPTFQSNFFADFRKVIDETGGAKDKQGNKVDIKKFDKLDFKPIFEYMQAQSEMKKNRSKEEKKAESEAKKELEKPYNFCKWDGRTQKVGNFRVEPPSLFRGRGEHPKTGRLKLRVAPEQITINIGKEAKVPAPPPGHKWKAVQHDKTATWLAMWQENINGAYKYVMLAANSDVKGQADFNKFEKARELKKYIDKIRRDYTRDLRAEVMADRQRATAIYLIDKLALRAGNEKDTENEAETVGCCSLKYEHITLREPDTVIFDFLGKDSIRYYDEVKVERQVFKNLKMFKKPPKSEGDDIFDRLTTSSLNKHLSTYMKGLTAKVFRTYNASYTMSKLLGEMEANTHLTMAEKIAVYNKANREVAILCNHKRTVGANHEAQMEKLGDRIKGLKYQKWRTKAMMLAVDPKQKKKKGADYFALDEELDEQWIQDHIKFLVEEQRTKTTKKFEKENEKRKADGEKPHPEKELKARLKEVDELEKQLKKEAKTKKVEPEGKSPSVDKYETAVKKIDERIHTQEIAAADREGNKEVALGTSKINYIDPRLTVVFCKKFDVPIEKFFSKTLREKFNWAIKSIQDDEWEF